MSHFRIGCSHVLLLLLHLIFVHPLVDKLLTPPTDCTSTLGSASWKGPGPALPTLPLQYSMKVEANILQNRWTTEVEEHFDSINQRASVSLTRNGTTTISIFDFKAKQRYDIYANGTCRSRPTGNDFFGVVTLNKQTRPAMATVNEVFRFGAQFNITYMAQETVRGIPVSHWTSCQSWTHLGAKFQLDYYFSTPDYTTASGQSEIPIRAVLNGLARNVDASGDQINGVHTFQHIYEFNSFRSGPVLNEDVFQIPPGILCSGRNDNRALPEIPNQLELSLEVVIPERRRRPQQEYLVYDSSHKLQETITTSVINAGSSSVKTVTISTKVVRDSQSGLVYSTEMASSTCTVDKMAASSMSHGQQLLAVSNGSGQFVYQGQTTFRRLLVDVWAMEQPEVITEVYFLPKSGLDSFQTMVGMFIKNVTSISTNDLPKMLQDVFRSYSSSVNEYDDVTTERNLSSADTPTGDQLSWGLQLERLLDQHTSQKIINIFQYRPLSLGVDSFQVSQCYPASEISRIVLFIMANYTTDVLANFLGFFNSVRDILARKVGVSILHISDLNLTPSRFGALQHNSTQAAFTLLGSTTVQGKSQKSIKDAKENLKASIVSGITFQVQYGDSSKDFSINKTIYFIDYNQQQVQESTKLPFLHAIESSSNDPPKSNKAEQTYSQGTVAGIALVTLVLGALLCLVIAVLFYRRKKPEEPLVPHQDTI